MIPSNENIADPTPAPKRKRALIPRIIRGVLFSLLGLVILIVLLVVGATYWLTPQRLAEIINREASENLYADVRAHNVQFTLWSSFPHLRVEMDSLTVRSRVFDSIPSNIKENLPQDAAFLASTGHFKGGLNLLSLLRGEISLTDVSLGALRLNLFSLNDSLSNFNILPPDTVKSKIPYITADRIRLLNPGSIRYRSIPDSADARVAINSLSLSRKGKKVKGEGIIPTLESDLQKGKRKEKGKYDTYTLNILGNIDAEVDNFAVLKGFPFSLDGDVALAFDPLRFATSNYQVNLGAIHSNIDMKMQMGDNSGIDLLAWHLNNFDLLKALRYIPGINLSSLESVDIPLRVNATARLTSPWRLSSDVLPSAEVDFNIEDGEMRYTLTDGTTCSLVYEGAGGRLFFDGINPQNSSFVIPPFQLKGEGVDLTLAGDMTSLLGSPHISAAMEGNALLSHLSAAFPFLRPYKLKGKIETLATIQAAIPPLEQLSSPQAMQQADITADGKIDMKDFSASFQKGTITASGKEFSMDLSGGYENGNISSKIIFSGEGKGLSLAIPKKGMKIDLKDLKLGGTSTPDASKTKLSLKSSGLNLTAGSERLQVDNILLDLDADKLKNPVKIKNYRVPSRWLADSASRAFAPHSPEFLTVNLPKDAKDFMAQWHTALQLKIDRGNFSSPSFPGKNILRNFDMAASFDSIVIRNLSLRSRASAMNMRGSVRNLRQFLNSSTPAPLYVTMDVAMDTIQINQLAGTFLKGKHGKRLDASPDEQPDDTVAMLLPRNIFADINLSAKQTRYINLHLYDLASAISLANGNLDVKNLRIGADFGHAYLNFNLATEDIQAIGMKADLGLMDVNVVNFFKNFHALLLMMPQMKNIEGNLSLEMNANLLSFPNMYINIPSLNADIRAQGDGLTVHQSPFIRRITHMLLIREGGPLHIADMNVHASVHDNLLELYPFTFSVDRYRLKMMGVNNFDGDLYYHIGVEKSPIPFPFGINIIGEFSHPKIRFGGEHWKIKKGEMITSSVAERHRFNIISIGRKFLKEFLHKAAQAETDPNLSL